VSDKIEPIVYLCQDIELFNYFAIIKFEGRLMKCKLGFTCVIKKRNSVC